IFFVPLDVTSNRRADHIHLHVVFAGPLQRRLRQLRRQSCAPQLLGNFRVQQCKHVSRNRVLEVCHASILLELEPSRLYLLRWLPVPEHLFLLLPRCFPCRKFVGRLTDKNDSGMEKSSSDASRYRNQLRLTEKNFDELGARHLRQVQGTPDADPRRILFRRRDGRERWQQLARMYKQVGGWLSFNGRFELLQGTRIFDGKLGDARTAQRLQVRATTEA